MENIRDVPVEKIELYSRRIPHRLKSFDIPNDFNDFLSVLHGNMLFSVGLRVNFNSDEVNSIVHNFIIHMLEKDHYGVARYKKYNSRKYPDIPYYKWFFKNLNYFLLGYWKAVKKNNLSLKVCDVENVVPTSVENDKVGCVFNMCEVDSTILMGELNEFLEIYSKNGDNAFKKNAHTLFIFKMEGYMNVELAYLFDISQNTVVFWMKKLGVLVLDFLSQSKIWGELKV